jgi:KDO2-lipid IV(A) lauroyltransferase
LYILFKLAELIIQNIPRKAGYFLFALSAYFSFYFDKKRRDTLRENLSAAIGPEKVNDALLKKVFVNYAKYYCDIFMKSEKVKDYVPGECDAYFRNTIAPAVNAIHEKGRGSIFISMHYGSWDTAGSYAAGIFPGRINVVVEKLSDGLFRWFKEKRERLGMKVIEATDIKTMIRVLKAGEILILLGDRDLGRRGYKMDYFGKKAYIPSGPAKIALMAGVPIFVGVSPRDEQDNYCPMLNLPPINEQCVPRSDEAAENITRQIVSAMETFVKNDPSQWCMLQEVFVKE